jgi:hypothetical protein
MSLARLRELRSGLDILKSAVVVRKFVTLGPLISRNFDLGVLHSASWWISSGIQTQI